MNSKQFYLSKLAEAASSLSCASLKAQQLGNHTECHCNGASAEQIVCDKLEELQVVVDMLNNYYGLGYAENEERVQRLSAALLKEKAACVAAGQVSDCLPTRWEDFNLELESHAPQYIYQKETK